MLTAERMRNLVVGRLINTARRRKGLSQEELGAAIGLDRQSVSDVEAGRTGITSLRQDIIAETLGLDPDLLRASEVFSLESDERDLITVYRLLRTREARTNLFRVANAIASLQEHAPC